MPTVIVVGICLMLGALVLEFLLGVADACMGSTGNIFFGPAMFGVLGLFLAGVLTMVIGGLLI